jgi:hypothetical protein
LARLLPVLDTFSFTAQFFLLRLTSYVLALCGVAFGLLAVNQPDQPPERNPAIIGFVLYPIILPMFFPEFARLGNDSLCLFFAGLAAYFLALWLKDDRNTRKSLAVGVALGLGLLTKAFFLPITLALGIFLAIRLSQDKENLTIKSGRFRSSASIFLAAIVVGGGWYIYKLLLYGEFTGSDDSIRLAHQGGMIAAFKDHFSAIQLLRGAVMPFASYQWPGTWSVARLPDVFQLPMLALGAWVVIAYLRQLKGRSMADAVWLPVWVFCLFVLGLLWHVLVEIALVNLGATGGWYLHILMPWVAPAIGVGIASIVEYRRPRLLLLALLIYALAYHVFALWAQLALFTGCAIKGVDKYYTFSGGNFCFDQAATIMHRLAVLGYPAVAAVGFCAGLMCLVWLMGQVRRGFAVESP